jgi:hypothetical protein
MLKNAKRQSTFVVDKDQFILEELKEISKTLWNSEDPSLLKTVLALFKNFDEKEIDK